MTLTRTLAERSIDNCATSRVRLDAERAELPSGGFGVLQLVNMIAIMIAASATHDYNWAFSRLEHDWPVYLKSMLHGAAYIASVAHLMHARLLIGRHVATRSSEDIARVIRPDIRAIASMPETPYRDSVLARLRARCAAISGDRAAAIDLFQQSARLLDGASTLDEPERDRFAIGCLMGGEEGSEICAKAVSRLRELGALVPLEELRSSYPELFRDAASAAASSR